jgi:hypothetical protein
MRSHLNSSATCIFELVFFSLRLLRDHSPATRYEISDITLSGLTDLDTGAFGDFLGLSYCTIPWSSCDRIYSLIGQLALPSSVRGWWLWPIISAERISRTALLACFLPSSLRYYRWPVDCSPKSPTFLPWRPLGTRSVLAVRPDQTPKILDIFGSF